MVPWTHGFCGPRTQRGTEPATQQRGPYSVHPWELSSQGCAETHGHTDRRTKAPKNPWSQSPNGPGPQWARDPRMQRPQGPMHSTNQVMQYPYSRLINRPILSNRGVNYSVAIPLRELSALLLRPFFWAGPDGGFGGSNSGVILF